MYHDCNRLQGVILQLHLAKVITPARRLECLNQCTFSCSVQSAMAQGYPITKSVPKVKLKLGEKTVDFSNSLHGDSWRYFVRWAVGSQCFSYMTRLEGCMPSFVNHVQCRTCCSCPRFSSDIEFAQSWKLCLWSCVSCVGRQTAEACSWPSLSWFRVSALTEGDEQVVHNCLCQRVTVHCAVSNLKVQ